MKTLRNKCTYQAPIDYVAGMRATLHTSSREIILFPISRRELMRVRRGSSIIGTPTMFCDLAGNLVFWPTPDADYVVEFSKIDANP